ncbi:uncharacterized protein LOC135398287 [Ornithodoros turicata]|uniref:uncharacterized protein LOC135398287 n=1 Tax=Ornithodoros turicata TaxID=34597 RepID=UPI003138BF08
MPNDVRKSKPVKAAKKKHDSESPKRPAGDTHGRKPAVSRPGSPERPKKLLDKANLHPHLYRYSRSISSPWAQPATAAPSAVPSPVNQTVFLYPGAVSRPVSPDRTEGFLHEKKRPDAPHVTRPYRGAPETARRQSVVPLTELPKRPHAVWKKQDDKGAKRWRAFGEKAQPAETELPAPAPAQAEAQRRKVGAARPRKQNTCCPETNQEALCIAAFFILQTVGITLIIYYITAVLERETTTEGSADGSYDDMFGSSAYDAERMID